MVTVDVMVKITNSTSLFPERDTQGKLWSIEIVQKRRIREEKKMHNTIARRTAPPGRGYPRSTGDGAHMVHRWFTH